MSGCCVSGCRNRHSTISKLKFYRIPSGYRTFNANRRRLWLQAIEKVNGSSEGLMGNVRVCGAHFISGEASMDYDDPDFVPSVFTCTRRPKSNAQTYMGRRRSKRCTETQKPSYQEEESSPSDETETSSPLKTSPPSKKPAFNKELVKGKASVDHDSSDLVPSVFPAKSPKRKANMYRKRRKSKRRAAKAKKEEEEEESSEDQSLDSNDETEESSSSFLLEEGEPLSDDETKTIEPQAKSSPIMASPTLKPPAWNKELNKGIPSVLLRRVYIKEQGFLCEVCDQSFTKASQLVEHLQVHEEDKSTHSETLEDSLTDFKDVIKEEPVDEPSFPCNICDRSFTTTHHLKRHKLLHVKDGRKCSLCGVLFCQRHNHVAFLPQAEPVIVSEEDDSVIDVENSLDEPNPTSDLHEDAQSSVTVTPLETEPALPASKVPRSVCRTIKPLPPYAHTRVLTEMPLPVLKKCFSNPHNSTNSNSGASVDFKKPLPYYQTSSSSSQRSLPKDVELPPSLQMFSPKFLTSAFLEVKRNYDRILGKPSGIKKERKEEPREVLVFSKSDPSVQDSDVKETVFDLDVVF